jgi:transcription antitermination factor NusG
MGEAYLIEDNLNPSIAPMLETYLGALTVHPWYALRVRAGSESTVVEMLEYRGFSAYCPTQKERRRYSDRMKVVAKPVFPGYVFCSFDISKKVPVISCPGVDYVVGCAGVPSAVPDVQIENIRRMVAAGAVACERFAAGDRVRVTHGPLQGVEGILAQEPRGNRLVVSVDLLNRAASLYIDKDQLSTVHLSGPVR